MNYRRLGNSGLKVSEIALGSWLTFGKSVNADQTKEIVHTAFEGGINFFDTANVYNRGEAEIVLGKVLKDFPRESYVLATKVFGEMGEGPNDRGLSRKHIMEQANASLKRLGVDYVDLYQAHRFDTNTPLEETLRAFDDLVRQGKALYIGVSEWTAQQITEAVALAKEMNFDRIISNQPRYSMIQRSIEDEVLPVSQRFGIGQVVFSPLAQGVLTGKYTKRNKRPEGSRAANQEINQTITGRFLKDEYLDVVEKLQRIAVRNGITLSQLALAWVLRQDGVSSAIIGASRPEQITENVKASGVRLAQKDIDVIEDMLSTVDTK